MNFEYVDNLVIHTGAGADMTYAEARAIVLLVIENAVQHVKRGVTDSGVSSDIDKRIIRTDALMYFVDGRYAKALSACSIHRFEYPEGIEERINYAAEILTNEVFAGKVPHGLNAPGVIIHAAMNSTFMVRRRFWNMMDDKFGRRTPSGRRAVMQYKESSEKYRSASKLGEKRVDRDEPCPKCGQTDWSVKNGRCLSCRRIEYQERKIAAQKQAAEKARMV